MAQQHSVSYPANPRYAVQRMEEQFGLGAVTATAMGQDAQGFLWIGTQTGLYRYDGARAKNMSEVESLTGHYILDLLIAPDGTPWFAGNHGVAHYKNGAFQRLDIPTSVLPLGAGNQLLAVDSRGRAYVVLFKGGIIRVDPGDPSATVVIEQKGGSAGGTAGIVRDASDGIWFTSGGRLAHVAAGETKAQLDPTIKLPNERVVALLFDGQQTLWLRTATHLARLDSGRHKITFEKSVTGSANQEEGKPSLDQDGRLMVPSSAGLYWQERGHWRTLTDKQGITSNVVQACIEDREGTLWIAGYGTGIDRLPGLHEWSAWTAADGLPDNSTWSTLRDRSGRLWISTGHGIGVWNAEVQRWEKIPSLEQRSRRETQQLQLGGDGSVWTTSAGSLIRIDPKDFSTSFYPSYRGHAFLSIEAAPDGSIWATTGSRIVRFDTSTTSPMPVDVPLPAESPGLIEYLSISPQGAVWATGPGVLYRYLGDRWRMLTMRDGLQGQTINSILAINDNEVWIGYNDVVGVSHVQLDARGAPHMTHQHKDWALVGRDSRKRVWFDASDGIAILSPDGRVQRLSHADGLIWDDVSPWDGVREEADGSFMIATSRGLSRYRPSERLKPENRASVVLTSVSLGGEERQLTEVAEVASSQGALAVEFSPLVLDAPERVSCVYELNGLDQQATETPLREVRYGGLPPGKYEFWVKCQRPNAAVDAATARFRFRVLPNFWQTWWARGAGAVMLLLGIWAFVSLRTRALNRRQVELEQAVAQRNAELLLKNKELEEISLTDPLTGTRNRRYFYETISTDTAQALRSHQRPRNRMDHPRRNRS